MTGGDKLCSEEAKLSTSKMEENPNNVSSDSKLKPAHKKHRGWKAMPYILGNETFERLATSGLVANFMVYLMREFHLNQVNAANIVNIWWGVSNFAPLLGAFISDAYAGRFKTITFASFAALLGMLAMTLTAGCPQLHPSKCDIAKQPLGQCKGPNKSQLAVLLTSLGLMAIGIGGIRPCSIPFGIDQFDQSSEKGVKQIKSFINLYYTSFTVVLLIAQTALVYVQDSVSWVLGFAIPTGLMLVAIILFFAGTKIYVLVPPAGSIFSGIARVCVAAFKKRRLKHPEGENDGLFYDPPTKETLSSKLPLTNQFRFLNKAAMVVDNELKPDGTPINRWRLGSIQQVEEVKSLLKIIPIFFTGIITLIAMLQQLTFSVSQAMKMDRHLGPKFQIPPGSMVAISYLTIVIWVPIYDRMLVPALRKITKHEGGITILQRSGIGILFTILAMIVAGFVERKRRDLAHLHPQPLGYSPLSVAWLAPQLILMGFSEAFFLVGMLEFFNGQFPDNMKSIGNALISCSFGTASYFCSLMITIIHGTTGKDGHPDWLTNDINFGKLDYLYFIIAGMEVLNFFYFLYCAHHYHYMSIVRPKGKSYSDLELVGSVP